MLSLLNYVKITDCKRKKYKVFKFLCIIFITFASDAPCAVLDNGQPRL